MIAKFQQQTTATTSTVNGEMLSALLNIAGKQRMLSQRIILHVVLATNNKPNALTLAQDSLRLFQNNYNLLVNGDQNYPGLFSQDLVKIFSKTDGVGKDIEDFILNATQSIASIRKGHTRAISIQYLIDNTTKILQKLNQVTEIYETELRKYTEQMQSHLKENNRRLTTLLERLIDVAKETRLISFNARAIAARSGHAGKQFDVVASEIGRLTNEMNDAAKTAVETLRESKDK